MSSTGHGPEHCHTLHKKLTRSLTLVLSQTVDAEEEEGEEDNEDEDEDESTAVYSFHTPLSSY